MMLEFSMAIRNALIVMQNFRDDARVLVCLAFVGAVCLLPASAGAYEADVHYGLTKWLASKAGFTEWQAEAIAMGDNRVDSGMPSMQEVVLDYACVDRSSVIARTIQERHYPSDQTLPRMPKDRVVVADSPAARKLVDATLAKAAGKAPQYLGLFGASLHTLQDSWSHAGEPAVPTLGNRLDCDPTLSSAPPMRPGAGPHGANLSFPVPDDVVAMAKATYATLQKYPQVHGQMRNPVPWSNLANAVADFAAGRTKATKGKWFREQGFESTEFLWGINLPDGPSPVATRRYDAVAMPALAQFASQQHDAPPGTTAYFDRLLARWLGNEPAERIVREMGAIEAADISRKADGRQAVRERDELAAKMQLWKIRDHGSVAALAHISGPISAAQMREIRAATSDPRRYVRVDSPDEAFLPLVTKGEHPSPLLPYIVRQLPVDAGARSRVIAIMRLKHAPYDTLGWIAERFDSQWRLVDIVAEVDQ